MASKINIAIGVFIVLEVILLIIWFAKPEWFAGQSYTAPIAGTFLAIDGLILIYMGVNWYKSRKPKVATITTTVPVVEHATVEHLAESKSPVKKTEEAHPVDYIG